MILDLKSTVNKTQLIKRLNSLVLSEKNYSNLSASPYDVKEKIMSDYAESLLERLKQAGMDNESIVTLFVDSLLKKIQDYSQKDLNNINVLMKESAELEMLSLVLRWSMEH